MIPQATKSPQPLPDHSAAPRNPPIARSAQTDPQPASPANRVSTALSPLLRMYGHESRIAPLLPPLGPQSLDPDPTRSLEPAAIILPTVRKASFGPLAHTIPNRLRHSHRVAPARAPLGSGPDHSAHSARSACGCRRHSAARRRTISQPLRPEFAAPRAMV
jgi:hypothetical protein